MKTLHMIFSKVRMIICNNPFIFVILCLGLMVCNLMFIYTYGLNEEFKTDTNVADYYMYQYEDTEPMTVEFIKQTLDDFDDDFTADYMSVIDSNTSVVADNAYDFSEYLIRTRDDAVSFFKVHTGNIKNLDGTNTVIVPADFAVSIGDIILLNGVEFRVVGTTSTMYFILSPENFVTNGFTPDIVTLLILDNGASKDILSELFYGKYDVEYVKNQVIEDDAKAIFYRACLLYILCALSFLYLCAYIYDDSAYELNVYQMLGASQGKIITILGGAMFIILSAVSLLSQIIHVLLFDSVFSKFFTEGVYFYSLVDYLKIYASSMMLVFSFIILYIILKTRKSTILNARKTIN